MYIENIYSFVNELEDFIIDNNYSFFTISSYGFQRHFRLFFKRIPLPFDSESKVLFYKWFYYHFEIKLQQKYYHLTKSTQVLEQISKDISDEFKMLISNNKFKTEFLEYYFKENNDNSKSI